ncbi:hypothetical protein C1645_882069 [Glomus cerebriforme]|uniref:F-box domain-containing protein n=1 Tax=Glomus cerebriforme TaxID=658196 RepID=A0A397S548_9GLOM|nr:hypothetical protein C1645_882069 [Glomus cerebriforme]
MDATYLPELCMKEILIILKNNPSCLLKCSLINRHWNQYFLPELWENPFLENSESKIDTKKLIETFIRCLSFNEKRSILDSIIDLTIIQNPYLMYSKYLKVIDLGKLVNYIKSYYPVNHHLQIYKLLCFNFISNSTNLSKIILSKHSVFNNNTDIFLYSNARNLSTLKEIEFNGKSLSGLILNCRKICKDLQTITFYCLEDLSDLIFSERYSGDKYLNLKNLIKSQKNLKNLNIHGFLLSQNKYLYDAINFQSSSLKSIKFESIDFNKNCTLSYLIKCENLEELFFLNCKFYGNMITDKKVNHKNNDSDYDSDIDDNDEIDEKDETILKIDDIINFQFKSNLKFLKFENCNQFDFYDNYSLIISIFRKNLKYLHIKGDAASIGLKNINLLSLIASNCENLEELQISKCYEYYNNNNDHIIINKFYNINDNFQIKSNLKFIKFEDCNQIHLLDNYLFIISICGQNLQYLYIRGKEILRSSKNINLLLIISTNCFNLLLLKISIIDKYINYIPTLFSSCQKLQHVTFNNYDQNILININLSEIGKSLPLSIKRFTMKMNLNFTPENFKHFLINIKNNFNLEVLNFRNCVLFSNDHLNILILYGIGHLKRLKINNAIKVDHDELLKANQFIKIDSPKILEDVNVT